MVQDGEPPTIYVYAFEGAGAEMRVGLAPFKNVGKQAVELGAVGLGAKLVYHRHTWTGGAAAEAQLVRDWARSKKGDKFIVTGYSYGGAAAAGLADVNLLLKWDLVFTIDPVNGLPGVPFTPIAIPRLKKVWVNYWQNVDTNSLLLPLPVTGKSIRGQPIGGADNAELGAAAFAKQDFYVDAKFNVSTYPTGQVFAHNKDRAHIWIPYDKVVLDRLVKKIGDL